MRGMNVFMSAIPRVCFLYYYQGSMDRRKMAFLWAVEQCHSGWKVMYRWDESIA